MNTLRRTSASILLLGCLGLLLAGCPGDPDPVPEPTPVPTAPPTAPPTATPAPTPVPAPPKIVLLVRHGEKEDDPTTDDPSLSAAGRARARQLVHVLGPAGIRAIYATHFRRTQQTAEPLAKHLGLTVDVTVAREVDEMVAKILASPEPVVLAVGHSDSVTTLIEKLGGGVLPPIDHEEYDNLYVVTLLGPGRATVAALQYGTPSVLEP